MTILEDVKSGLMILDDSFDKSLLIEIQTAFSILSQLGIEKAATVPVTETSEWSDFFGKPELMMCKTYVIKQTQMVFDPPTLSFQITAQKELLDELKERIVIHASLKEDDG